MYRTSEVWYGISNNIYYWWYIVSYQTIDITIIILNLLLPFVPDLLPIPKSTPFNSHQSDWIIQTRFVKTKTPIPLGFQINFHKYYSIESLSFRRASLFSSPPFTHKNDPPSLLPDYWSSNPLLDVPKRYLFHPLRHDFVVSLMTLYFFFAISLYILKPKKCYKSISLGAMKFFICGTITQNYKKNL